jgi:hypothetical protein
MAMPAPRKMAEKPLFLNLFQIIAIYNCKKAQRLMKRPNHCNECFVGGVLMLIRVLGLTLLAVTAAGPAYAYIDPGSGSFIIQMLFGLMAGAAVFLSDVRQWFARLFSKILGRTPRKPNGGP